jgi:hypothetical protein
MIRISDRKGSAIGISSHRVWVKRIAQRRSGVSRKAMCTVSRLAAP